MPTINLSIGEYWFFHGPECSQACGHLDQDLDGEQRWEPNRTMWFGEVVDGEVVDAPRALPAEVEPAPRIVCVTHRGDCDLRRAGCVQQMTDPERPDTRTWAERASTFRVVDHRRVRGFGA